MKQSYKIYEIKQLIKIFRTGKIVYDIGKDDAAIADNLQSMALKYSYVFSNMLILQALDSHYQVT
jgi:hypothetical protein